MPSLTELSGFNDTTCTNEAQVSFAKVSSDVPVWLRVQLWESIPDPHYNKFALSFATVDDEDLQLLTRPQCPLISVLALFNAPL